MSKDMRERVGKIEVVVLRCDAPREVPRAGAREPSAAKASVKAPSAKAPSAKAPSAKAPSAKAPSEAKAASAASGGMLGGMFGLFDGACDFGLDGAGDAEPTPTGAAGMDWETTAGQDGSSRHDTSDDAAEDQAPPSFGLDGQGYDHPGVVVNQYGQPYDPRVPYYHVSNSWRPSPGDHRRPSHPPVPYNTAGTVPAQTPAQTQQRPAYPPYPVTSAAQQNVTQVDQGPPTGFTRSRSNPAILYDAEGNKLLDRAALPPGHKYALPQEAPQPQQQYNPTSYNPPLQSYPAYEPQANTKYQSAPQQYTQQHQQTVVPEPQEPRIVDPEWQRFQIFNFRQKLEEILGVDHRFIAAAVPHLPLLQTVPVPQLLIPQMRKIGIHLQQCIDHRCWPNGEPLGSLLDLVFPSTEHRKHRTPEKRRESSHTSEHKGSGWNNEGSGRHRRKSGRDDEAKSGSRHSSRSSQSITHSHGKSPDQGGEATGAGWGNKDNQDDQTDSPWPDNNDQNNDAGGDWNNQNTNDNNNDTFWGGNNKQQADQSWGDNNNNDSNKAADASWGPTKPASNAQDKPSPGLDGAPAGGGWGNTSNKAPSSRASKTPSSTSSADPYANVQSYFKDWRGNVPNSTKKPHLHHQPREPYAYPAGPTPHLPADQVGDRSHGMQPGKGADYTHKTYRPQYLDTMEQPYAVFVFKYRSAEKLEEILGIDIKRDLAIIAEEVGRGVLMGLPREKLVEQLMKNQAQPRDSGNGKDAARAWEGDNTQETAGAAQGNAWGGEDKKSSGGGGGWGGPASSHKSGSHKTEKTSGGKSNAAGQGGGGRGSSKAPSVKSGNGWGNDARAPFPSKSNNGWNTKPPSNNNGAWAPDNGKTASASKNNNANGWAQEGQGRTTGGKGSKEQGKTTPEKPQNMQFSLSDSSSQVILVKSPTMAPVPSNASSRTRELMKLPVFNPGFNEGSRTSEQKNTGKDQGKGGVTDYRMW